MDAVDAGTGVPAVGAILSAIVGDGVTTDVVGLSLNWNVNSGGTGEGAATGRRTVRVPAASITGSVRWPRVACAFGAVAAVPPNTGDAGHAGASGD